MKLTKILSFFSLAITFITLLAKLTIILFSIYIKLAVYPTIQTWKFKKKCKKYVKGQNLENLVRIYDGKLKDMRNQFLNFWKTLHLPLSKSS